MDYDSYHLIDGESQVCDLNNFRLYLNSVWNIVVMFKEVFFGLGFLLFHGSATNILEGKSLKHLPTVYRF